MQTPDSLYTPARNASLASSYASSIAAHASKLADLDHIALAARDYRTSKGR